MKVEIENLNGNFKKLKIEIPADIITKRVDTHFKNIQNDVTLKGFRKGKAPMALVRETYGPQENPRITRDLVNEYLNKAIVDNALAPVASPEINLDKPLLEGAPFAFTANFENLPPVVLKDYASFKAATKKFTVEDSEIQETLGNIQQQLSKLEKAPDGTVMAKGMVAQMDYEGTENGVRVESTCAVDAFVEPGNGQLIEDFDNNVIGLKKGDSKEFKAKFPTTADEGQEPHPLAGKTLQFKVTVKDVYNKNLPALDDELAKKVGPFENFDALKTRVIEDIKNQKEQTQRREVQEQAIQWLIEKNPVQAPETLVNQQIQNLAIEAGMQLQNMGLPQEQIEERLKEWSDEMTGRATTQVKASLLLGAIGREEKIQVNDEDIRKELGRMATQMRKNPQEIVKDMQEKNMIAGFMRQIQELKALDWLLEKAMS
ncbi:MAG: trigger factor [Bdellovibrionota bacterium]